LLIGVNYRSKSFRLLSSESTVAPLDYAFNHSEILLSVKIDQHLGSWIWTSVKAGYQVNFSSEFDSNLEIAPSFQADPKDGAFIQFSLFVSPEWKKK